MSRRLSSTREYFTKSLTRSGIAAIPGFIACIVSVLVHVDRSDIERKISRVGASSSERELLKMYPKISSAVAFSSDLTAHSSVCPSRTLSMTQRRTNGIPKDFLAMTRSRVMSRSSTGTPSLFASSCSNFTASFSARPPSVITSSPVLMRKRLVIRTLLGLGNSLRNWYKNSSSGMLSKLSMMSSRGSTDNALNAKLNWSVSESFLLLISKALNT